MAIVLSILVGALSGLVPCQTAPTSRPAVRNVRWTSLPETNTVFQPRHYDSLKSWQTRRAWLRGQVRFAAGLLPAPKKAPLHPTFVGRIEREECSIEKVYFESQAGILVTGNLYRPRNAAGKRPAIACPHGHWARGRIHHDDVGSIPARCITLAKLGFVVFAYDMLSYNDSGKVLKFDHRSAELNSPAHALWGIGPLPLQTWNSIRVLDFLQSLPDVDPDRIGVTGASGGGTQTFILSAIDDRVKAAVPVNMISSTMQGGCVCENAPGLRFDTQNMEIAALFAPKPLLMISASGDWTAKTPQVEFPFVRSIYELYGKADQVANVHIDAGHNYNRASREAMYPWFVRWLQNDPAAGTIEEGPIKLDRPEDLLIFDAKNPPPYTLTLDEVAARIKDAARKQVAAMTPHRAGVKDRLSPLVRSAVRHAVGSNFPASRSIRKTSRGGTTTYTRGGRAVRTRLVGALSADDRQTLTILIDPAGLAADASAFQGAVLVVEPFGTGKAVPPADLKPPRGSTAFFTTFNRTDDAEAAYDILTVLASALHDEPWKRVNLVATGRMGPIALAARTLVPADLVKSRRLRTVIDLNGFDAGSDDAYLKGLHLPNIRRVGGLSSIAFAAANGPLRLHNMQASLTFGNSENIQATPERADARVVAEWLSQQP